MRGRCRATAETTHACVHARVHVHTPGWREACGALYISPEGNGASPGHSVQEARGQLTCPRAQLVGGALSSTQGVGVPPSSVPT